MHDLFSFVCLDLNRLSDLNKKSLKLFRQLQRKFTLLQLFHKTDFAARIAELEDLSHTITDLVMPLTALLNGFRGDSAFGFGKLLELHFRMLKAQIEDNAAVQRLLLKRQRGDNVDKELAAAEESLLRNNGEAAKVAASFFPALEQFAANADHAGPMQLSDECKEASEILNRVFMEIPKQANEAFLLFTESMNNMRESPFRPPQLNCERPKAALIPLARELDQLSPRLIELLRAHPDDQPPGMTAFCENVCTLQKDRLATELEVLDAASFPLGSRDFDADRFSAAMLRTVKLKRRLECMSNQMTRMIVKFSRCEWFKVPDPEKKRALLLYYRLKALQGLKELCRFTARFHAAVSANVNAGDKKQLQRLQPVWESLGSRVPLSVAALPVRDAPTHALEIWCSLMSRRLSAAVGDHPSQEEKVILRALESEGAVADALLCCYTEEFERRCLAKDDHGPLSAEKTPTDEFYLRACVLGDEISRVLDYYNIVREDRKPGKKSHKRSPQWYVDELVTLQGELDRASRSLLELLNGPELEAALAALSGICPEAPALKLLPEIAEAACALLKLRMMALLGEIAERPLAELHGKTWEELERQWSEIFPGIDSAWTLFELLPWMEWAREGENHAESPQQ